MRVMVRARVPGQRLWLAQWILMGCGVGLLCYCGFILADASIYQNRENRRLTRMLQRSVPRAALAADGLIGRMDIERLGVSVMVMEGTGESTLRRAAGHIAGTALPGEAGNVGIAGHRDTFFRPLRNIRRNDMIALTTLGGAYTYRVVSSKVVRPSDVGVLAPGTGEVLTLVTCYPFYFIGSAPERFIVRAERVGGASLRAVSPL